MAYNLAALNRLHDYVIELRETEEQLQGIVAANATLSIIASTTIPSMATQLDGFGALWTIVRNDLVDLANYLAAIEAGIPFIVCLSSQTQVWISHYPMHCPGSSSRFVGCGKEPSYCIQQPTLHSQT